jgi:hypothetical protein
MTPEDLLTRTFTEVTETTDYPSTPILTVVARARAVRRRRRRTAILAAAAAVAVVTVPTTILLNRSPDSTQTPLHEPTSGTTRSPTADSSLLQARALSALPRGSKPGVDYIRRSDYVAASGTTTHLPLKEITEATPFLGGFLVGRTGPDLGPRLTWLDNQLHAQWTRCGNGLTLSADRTLLTFVTDDCRSDMATIHLAVPSGMSNSDQTTTAHGLPVIPIGIARGNVVYSRLPGRGVFVAHVGGSSQRVPGLSYGGAVDPTGTYVAGQSTADEKTGELVDLETGAVLWEQPGYLAHFSQDGKYVLAASPGDESVVRVLDAATGDQIAVLTAPAGLRIEQTSWDDNDNVLAVVSSGGSSDGPRHEAIVRFALHGGSPTLATSPVRISGLQTGYRFAAGF